MWGFPSPQQPSPALHGCPLILQAPWFCDSSPITHPFTFQAIATFCDSCISIVTQQASFGLEDLTQSNPLWWLSRCQCVTVCCHSVPQGPLASLQFLDAMKKSFCQHSHTDSFYESKSWSAWDKRHDLEWHFTSTVYTCLK